MVAILTRPHEENCDFITEPRLFSVTCCERGGGAWISISPGTKFLLKSFEIGFFACFNILYDWINNNIIPQLVLNFEINYK
jgi:hypothetical protein